MPKSGKKDVLGIYEQYKKGATLKDLRERFGLKTSAQVKNSIIEAQIKLGQLPPLRRGRTAKPAAGETKVKVGKRGSIAISSKIVAALGFKAGDRFTVKRRGTAITLKKA
jgi:hypothetical protein